jgi:hypothetical protein
MLGVSKVDKVMKIVSRHIFYYFNVYMLFLFKNFIQRKYSNCLCDENIPTLNSNQLSFFQMHYQNMHYLIIVMNFMIIMLLGRHYCSVPLVSYKANER